MFYASRMAMCRALIPKLAYDNNSLVFLTTCGPATTFDPKITGVAGTWYFDDGTTLDAASGVEISKTFATDGLHRAVFRPELGGLAAITDITINTDLISGDATSQILKCANLGSLTAFQNTSLYVDLSVIMARCSKLVSLACGGSKFFGDLSIFSSLHMTKIDLNYSSLVTGSVSELPVSATTVSLYNSANITSGSIAHLVSVRQIDLRSIPWFTADVDLVLLSIANAIVADAAHFTYATPVINIGGTNEAPSGIYQAPTGPGGTPTSGLEAVWIMAHNTGHAWVVTFTGGVANELLLGNVAGTGEKSWAEIGALNTRTYAQRFVATSGSLSDLKIKVSGNTNMKMAVYTDVAGDPGTLLAASDEFSAVSGWNKVTLNTVCDLVTGSYYWITFKPSVSFVVYYNATGGAMSYKDTTYADAFTADFGAHSDTTADLAVGGYGLKVTGGSITPEKSLLGNVIGTGEKTWTADGGNATQLRAQKFLAVAGTLQNIKIKCDQNVAVKVAIYSDNAGSPDALIAYSAYTNAVTGWNTISLNTTATLTATYYWLAMKIETSSSLYYIATGGTTKTVAAAFASDFPATFPASTDLAYDFAIAGWGV